MSTRFFKRRYRSFNYLSTRGGRGKGGPGGGEAIHWQARQSANQGSRGNKGHEICRKREGLTQKKMTLLSLLT